MMSEGESEFEPIFEIPAFIQRSLDAVRSELLCLPIDDGIRRWKKQYSDLAIPNWEWPNGGDRLWPYKLR